MDFCLPKLPPIPVEIQKKPLFKNSFRVKDLYGVEEWMKQHTGPTDFSHWLIPGIVLISQCPSRGHNEEQTKSLLMKYLNVGITYFVSLRSKQEYRKVLSNSKCEFLLKGLPYRQPSFKFSLPEEQPFLVDVKKICDKVILKIMEGKKVLLHCYDGRDRSAVVGAELLRRLYPGITMKECFYRIQGSFGCRKRFPDSYPHEASPRSDEYRYLISLLFTQR